jgi:hypothetical protein
MQTLSVPSGCTSKVHKNGIRILRQVGEMLCRDEYPRVSNGGVLALDRTAIDCQLSSEEKADAEGQRNWPQSASFPWSWSPGQPWIPWQAGSSGSSDPASSVVGSDRIAWLDRQLLLAGEAYPGLRSWKVKNGTWLCARSKPIVDLPDTAMFFVYIPEKPCESIRAWGYWVEPEHTWIGPRHTNFNDGSICAFNPADATWTPDQGITNLLDLYTLWSVRHLHLREFGYWPGLQVAHHPYERLTEQSDVELCGCGSSNKTYEECCFESDDALDRHALLRNYLMAFKMGTRCPPIEVAKFSICLNDPPNLPNADWISLKTKLKYQVYRKPRPFSSVQSV